MIPASPDPKWRRRATWLWYASVALVALAVLAAPHRWFAVPLLLSGLAAVTYGVIELRDIGGVGSDDGSRYVAYYQKYLRRIPFRRDLPPNSATTYRRWFGAIATLIGIGYGAFAIAVLLGLQSRDIQ